MYLKSLRKKEKMLERSVEKAENHIEKISVNAPDFMKVYEALNLLRIDLATVRSRIQNYGKDRGGLEEVYISDL